jgi:hypothetical protein
MPEKPTNSLDNAWEKVVDEETFIDFLFALAADKADEAAKEREHPSSPYGPGQNGWEHEAIDDYLYAAARWAVDSDGAPMLPPKSTNPWRRCADILFVAKGYE